VFVIGLQAHAAPAFERLGQHIPNLLGFQIELPLMSLEAARNAVLAETRAMQLEVEPAALDAPTSAKSGTASTVSYWSRSMPGSPN